MYGVNEDFSIINQSFSNYRFWGHISIAMHNGREVDRIKINYLNSTHERYQFETAMLLLIDKLDKSKAIPLKDRYQA